MSGMGDWPLSTLTALGGVFTGYTGFWLQAAYTRRQERRKQEREEARVLAGKIREYLKAGLPDRNRVWTDLSHEAALLGHRKLRERVEWDFEHLDVMTRMRRDSQYEHDAFCRDAMACAAAIARGDRLPEPQDQVKRALWYQAIEIPKPPQLAPGLVYMGPDEEPDVDGEEVAYQEWAREVFRRTWRHPSRHRALLRHAP